MPELIFFGLPLLGNEDPLGVWTLASPALNPAATYAAEGDDGAVLSWHVQLPALSREFSADRAHEFLQERIAEVEERQAYLAQIEARLDAMDPAAPAATAYGAPDATMRDAEAELWATVAALQAPATAFAVQPQLRALYQRLYGEALALFEQFQQALSSYARIETEIGGKRLATTVVDSNGDFRTAWALDVTQDEMPLHLEAVRLAMASRQALLILVTVVVSGALVIAMKASVPGGPLLLIPAVYHYVCSVLKVWRQVSGDIRLS